MKFTKNIILAVALLGASLIGAGTASAMPAAPVGASQATQIVHVGWRCGPHRHMNRWHRCVWNGRR